MLAVVRRAGERQGVIFHPREHLVHLAHLPVPVRGTPVGQQGVGLVEDEELFLLARFGEGFGDLRLGAPDPHRQQVRSPFLQDFQPDPLGQVTDERALAGAGRSLKAEGKPPPPALRERIGQFGQIAICPDQDRVERPRLSLRRLIAVQQTGQAPHALAHSGDIAPLDKSGCGDRASRNARRHIELPGQRLGIRFT